MKLACVSFSKAVAFSFQAFRAAGVLYRIMASEDVESKVADLTSESSSLLFSLSGIPL